MATTFSTIYTAVMNSARMPVTNTAQLTIVKQIINDRYREICAHEEWEWLDKRYVVNTASDFGSSTVTCIAGSTAFTFATAPATVLGSFVGRKLVVSSGTPDSQAVYRISTHTAAAATGLLDVAWTNTSVATASCHVYQDEYSLPTDFLSPIDLQRYGYRVEAQPIGQRDMLGIKAIDRTVGKPQRWSVIDFATSGDPTSQRQLWLHPYPDHTYRVEVYYRRQATDLMYDSDVPAMPEEYRNVLIDGARATAYTVLLADESRGGYYEKRYQMGLMKMAQQNHEKTRQNPQMVPLDQHRGAFKGRRRITGAGVDLGSYFDRWDGER